MLAYIAKLIDRGRLKEINHRLFLGHLRTPVELAPLVAGFATRTLATNIRPGALAAMGEAGFALSEDHMKVWNPVSGAVLSRGPVITWASRSKPRIASSLGFAAFARHALKPMGIVRVAVHPGDTTVPSLLTSIDRTFSELLKGRTAGRYADLH